MDLLIRGNDVEVTDQIRQTAQRRVESFDRFLNRVVEAKLELRRTHQRTTADSFVAQITIQNGRDLLRAEERDSDLQRGLDKVLGKMERQVRRYHERRTDRHGPRPEPVEIVAAAPEPELDGDEPAALASLVRTKRFALKPMDPEEAIEQMELLGHDFYLFHNAEEDQCNVVYRRNDGSYGLLAPTRG